MPSVKGPTPEPFAEETVRNSGSNAIDVDPLDIGFAVTSGSHPNRRSRSAHALYDLAKNSPESIQDGCPRSDESRRWQDGPAPDPALDTYSQTEPTSRHSFRLLQDASTAPDSRASGKVEAGAEEVRHSGPDLPGHLSFDFQRLATTFNQQESIPLEDRVMIAEVKLMDLEYAISKLQARSPPSPSAQTATPRPEKELHVLPTGLTVTPLGRTRLTQAKSEPGSGSTTAGTVSTQPTAPSLSTAPEDDDPFVDDKALRPLSIETSLHRPEAGLTSAGHSASNPRASASGSGAEGHASGDRPSTSDPSDPSPSNRPVSLTSISIDHFTTLITLLKREQHARIRLEEEIAQLRRDVWHLLYPSPAPATTLYPSSSSTNVITPLPPPISSSQVAQHPPRSAGGLSTRSATSTHSTSAALASSNITGPGSGSLYRQRRWDGSRRDVVRIDDFHVARRRPSYEGAAMTFYDESESPLGRESTPDAGGRNSAGGAHSATGRHSAAGAAGGPGHPSSTADHSASAAGRYSASSARTGNEDDDSASETFATPIDPGPPLAQNPWSGEGQRGGRFEIAAGLWGRGEGEAF
jgi:hypothetical protein